MLTQVTLAISTESYRHAERLAEGVQQPVDMVLSDVLEDALGAWNAPDEAMQTWSDEQILQASEAQMQPEQSQRLSELLDRQQTGKLSDVEKPELWILARIYDIGQLRRAQALAEAVRRGLKSLA